MSEAKDTTIIMRVSPDLKEAIRVAAASENRKMSNFILTTLLEHPKVKAVLDEKKEKSEPVFPDSEEKQKAIEELESKKEEITLNLSNMKHNL